MDKKPSLSRSIKLGAAVLAGLIVYAYGFQVTKVSLEEISSPRRQESLVRILRALARPDLLRYEQQEFTVNAPIRVPCPAGGLSPPEPDRNNPYIIVTPACADPGAEIRVEGGGFEPDARGPLNFIPPSGVSLQMGAIATDASGHFEVTVKLPRRPSEETQTVRAVTRRNVGLPHFNQNAKDTWAKIIETVFLALLATTLGTALAVPLSFLAARNLMKPVTSPLSSVALSVLALPAGLLVGALAARLVGQASSMLTESVWLSTGGLVVGPPMVWGITRWALPQEETRRPTRLLRAGRGLGLLASALVGLLSLFLLASLGARTGTALAPRLGPLSFLGVFMADLGDILNTLIVLLAALAGAGVLAGAAGRLGQFTAERLPAAVNRVLDPLLAAAAGAVIAVCIGLALRWTYQLTDLRQTVYGPAALGALLGLALAIRASRNSTLPVGLVVYYITRTIFNTLRSIEPLVMAIVFVVWVGIGPFAGVLALALHTVVALAKLYSEQVESILPGPLEAITATGATRMQTVIYAVAPQIVPPYISFTMYRWDINVRMSTIIGFVGGGGIGLLLQQNINLLLYRAASAQMLAIAIVVASMDYLSSRLREHVI